MITLDTIKVAAVQTAIQPTIEESISYSLKLCEKAAKAKPDVICLPEQWLVMDSYKYIKEQCDVMNVVLSRFSRVAKKHELHILLGGCIERIDDKMYITCPVLNSRGEVILRQIKTHPFRSEQQFFSKDSEFTLFDIQGCKIGIMICYDLCFPEVARVLSLMGADIIFNPSRIRTDGISPWHLYGEMRSLENRIPVVSINVANPPQHSGGTIIHGIEQRENIVYPIAIAETGNEPGVVIGEVDFKYPRDLRRARLKDRNVKAYSLLLSTEVIE